MSTLELTEAPAVHTAMLIRRPPNEAFRAFADPAITTRFWFTKSSGELVAGARVRWDWEMYGAHADVTVLEIEEDRRIVFRWNETMTVELRFTPWEGGSTFVEVTETGATGTGDDLVQHVRDSTGGFTIALCALKALLEHGIELGAVRDRHPANIVAG
ncbi:SRPBCC family protein [Amycolatopsis sp. CA-230715]|uniref:SRPBCC family protein n=1 Tax=Amycolatopsis sp. CA-230715 TaxID=2745196 RepID=UPI001C01B60E|nr:SRPBCC family protein [Amycolatopsis sp. CA-230715]QWF83249.1 hypothetical protein HUW46_06689 [Amycolatopsis sp. CA-230715]